MYIDELMEQKKHVDDLITGLLWRYRSGRGAYRIESEMEHIVPGICGLPPGRKCEMRADEGLRMLLFLMDEKKAMLEAVIKCHTQNKRMIVDVHDCDFKAAKENNVNERIMNAVKTLYCKPAVHREIQKHDAFGYDVVLTGKSMIDGDLLDEIYGRLSRKLETLRQEIDEIDSLEADYAPTVDYSRYHDMNLEECLRALKERGAIKEWKAE